MKTGKQRLSAREFLVCSAITGLFVLAVLFSGLFPGLRGNRTTAAEAAFACWDNIGGCGVSGGAGGGGGAGGCSEAPAPFTPTRIHR